MEKPLGVICSKVLTQKSMKPSKLKQCLESCHNELVGKSIDYFRRKSAFEILSPVCKTKQSSIGGILHRLQHCSGKKASHNWRGTLKALPHWSNYSSTGRGKSQQVETNLTLQLGWGGYMNIFGWPSKWTPILSKKALNFLIQFPSTCYCEVGFSAMVSIKTKYRILLQIGDDMQCCLSCTRPRFEPLVAKKQYQPSH